MRSILLTAALLVGLAPAALAAEEAQTPVLSWQDCQDGFQCSTATFDAFALATAIGMRTSRISLRIGPLVAGVRSPVALALGLSTVVSTAGRLAALALGASSPRIVTRWHGRDWEPVRRMRETVRDTRAILDGERVAGFRLQEPVAGTPISVAAFGQAMTRVEAEVGYEVVLNLVSADHVADVHRRLAGGPPLAVWVPPPSTRAPTPSASSAPSSPSTSPHPATARCSPPWATAPSSSRPEQASRVTNWPGPSLRT